MKTLGHQLVHGGMRLWTTCWACFDLYKLAYHDCRPFIIYSYWIHFKRPSEQNVTDCSLSFLLRFSLEAQMGEIVGVFCPWMNLSISCFFNHTYLIYLSIYKYFQIICKGIHFRSTKNGLQSVREITKSKHGPYIAPYLTSLALIETWDSGLCFDSYFRFLVVALVVVHLTLLNIKKEYCGVLPPNQIWSKSIKEKFRFFFTKSGYAHIQQYSFCTQNIAYIEVLQLIGSRFCENELYDTIFVDFLQLLSGVLCMEIEKNPIISYQRHETAIFRSR